MRHSSISVVVPVYNRAGLVSQTLNSLLSQTVPAEEIIVVDDGSDDGTAEVVGTFPSPVRLIRQQNLGPGAARNRGVQESKGEFIHFFDSDDVALPNKHEIQLQTLRRSGADIAYGPWVKGWISQESFTPENHVLQQRGLPRRNLVKSLLTNWSIVPHACLFRRSVVERSGGFPEDLLVAEDQLMFLGCLLTGGKVAHSPGTLELYRIGEPGKITESSAISVRRLHDWGHFLLKARRMCLEHNIDPRKWFGFRGRCWRAAEDLINSGSTDAGLVAELRRAGEHVTPSIFYRSMLWLERWRGGVQQRLVGGRSHSAFRGGDLDPQQIQGIRSLGLAIGENALSPVAA